jgi:hypothetical protein
MALINLDADDTREMKNNAARYIERGAVATAYADWKAGRQAWVEFSNINKNLCFSDQL